MLYFWGPAVSQPVIFLDGPILWKKWFETRFLDDFVFERSIPVCLTSRRQAARDFLVVGTLSFIASKFRQEFTSIIDPPDSSFREYWCIGWPGWPMMFWIVLHFVPVGFIQGFDPSGWIFAKVCNLYFCLHAIHCRGWEMGDGWRWRSHQNPVNEGW